MNRMTLTWFGAILTIKVLSLLVVFIIRPFFRD
jgi:hypothetical protein